MMISLRRSVAWLIMGLGLGVGLLSYGLMWLADLVSPDAETFDHPDVPFQAL